MSLKPFDKPWQLAPTSQSWEGKRGQVLPLVEVLRVGNKGMPGVASGGRQVAVA